MEFPFRLLQSAVYITTSGVTAFLELLLNPISENFCQNSINEQCRDNKNYFYEENGPEAVFFKWFFTPLFKCLQINCMWRSSPIEEVELKTRTLLGKFGSSTGKMLPI